MPVIPVLEKEAVELKIQGQHRLQEAQSLKHKNYNKKEGRKKKLHILYIYI